MATDRQFDPYLEWLEIPLSERPADFYVLLGIKKFESDTQRIFDAADERMEAVRRYQTGIHSKLSQRLLNEISAARICLLDEQKRNSYNQLLKQKTENRIELPPLPQPIEIIPESAPQKPAIASAAQMLQPIDQQTSSFKFNKSSYGWLLAAVAGGGALVLILNYLKFFFTQ